MEVFSQLSFLSRWPWLVSGWQTTTKPNQHKDKVAAVYCRQKRSNVQSVYYLWVGGRCAGCRVRKRNKYEQLSFKKSPSSRWGPEANSMWSSEGESQKKRKCSITATRTETKTTGEASGETASSRNDSRKQGIFLWKRDTRRLSLTLCKLQFKLEVLEENVKHFRKELLFSLLLCLFCTRVSLCTPGWPGTSCIDQAIVRAKATF